MQRVLSLLFALIAGAAVLAAADATGTWTGNLTIKDDSGTPQSRPAHLVLKQDGATITGTAGPDANEQHPIEKGTIADGKITFEVPTGETVMKFTVTLDGDEIKGRIDRDRDGEHQTAEIHVTRQK